jgi:hypothetical protein
MPVALIALAVRRMDRDIRRHAVAGADRLGEVARHLGVLAPLRHLRRVPKRGAVLRPLSSRTHHAPHPDCIAPAQRDTWNAGNSASDLSALTDSGRAALWVHGHVHHSLDLPRPGGTRLLCNPAGAGFANLAFDENRVIALP